MSDLNIQHHQEFYREWKKATADGVITDKEIKDLKAAAAKTRDAKGIAYEKTDDYLVEQLEKKANGTTELKFVDTGGAPIKSKVDFSTGEIVLAPQDVTDQNVDLFLKQRVSTGYADPSPGDRDMAEKALRHLDKKSKAYEKIHVWLNQHYPGATAEMRLVLKNGVLVNFAGKDKADALEKLIKYADRDPKMVKALCLEVLNNPDMPASVRVTAAKALTEKGWGDHQLFENMINSSLAGVREAGIRGLAQTGRKEDIARLEAIYRTPTTESDRDAAYGALVDIGRSKKPNAALAKQTADKLSSESYEAGKAKAEAAKEKDEKAANLHARFEELKGSIRLAKNLKNPEGIVELIKEFNAKYGAEFLKEGRPVDKGEFVNLLMAVPEKDHAWARKWVHAVLTRTRTSDEHNKVLDIVRGDSKSAPNLEKFLGTKNYVDVMVHYSKLTHKEQSLDEKTALTLYQNKHEVRVLAELSVVDDATAARIYKGKAPETGDRIREWITALETGKRSSKDVEANVTALLKSLDTRENYDAMLNYLQKSWPSTGGKSWEARINAALTEAGAKEAIQASYEGPRAKDTTPVPGQAKKWNGPDPIEWAAKGAYVPDHHPADNEAFLDSLSTHKKPHSEVGHKATHIMGEHAVHHTLEHVGHSLAHHGYEVMGKALAGLGTAVSVVGYVKMAYDMAKGMADDMGPGQWRMAASNAYKSSYAQTFERVADLWKSSRDMEVFMTKLKALVPKTGDIDMSNPKDTYRSLGKIAGTRDALMQLMSLIDPSNGGSPGKLASYLDALTTGKNATRDKSDAVYAAVHRQNK